MAASTSLSLRPFSGVAPNQPKTNIFSKNKHASSPQLPFFQKPTNIHLSTRRHTFRARAVTVGSDRVDSSSVPTPREVKKYHFLVANAKFMLDEEEHFMELMFERLRLFGERNREIDFWLVIEPKFLDKFPNVAKRLKRPAVALVSTDANWITFMKLRLDRVLEQSFESDNFAEALASNPVDIKFDKPEKWVAPYPKYESGWWEAFLPKETSKSEA